MGSERKGIEEAEVYTGPLYAYGSGAVEGHGGTSICIVVT
jgi:hypothetical protein